MTERVVRLTTIPQDQDPFGGNEERLDRLATEQADARFLEAMHAAGYRASGPIVDSSPLCPARFAPEPTRLGNSSLAGV